MTVAEWLSNVQYDKDGGYAIWNVEKEDMQMIADIRGWGRLQHKFKNIEEAEKFQDEVGEFIAQAIREKVERDFKSK